MEQKYHDISATNINFMDVLECKTLDDCVPHRITLPLLYDVVQILQEMKSLLFNKCRSNAILRYLNQN